MLLVSAFEEALLFFGFGDDHVLLDDGFLISDCIFLLFVLVIDAVEKEIVEDEADIFGPMKEKAISIVVEDDLAYFLPHFH